MNYEDYIEFFHFFLHIYIYAHFFSIGEDKPATTERACELCQATFPRIKDYYVHMRGHFPGPPHRCDTCEDTLYWKESNKKYIFIFGLVFKITVGKKKW